MFNARGNPRNSLNGNGYSFLFGNTVAGKAVNERSAMHWLQSHHPMAKQAIGTGPTCGEYGAAFYQNSAQPGGVPKYPDVVKDP